MSNKNRSVVVSLRENGTTLVSKGKYSTKFVNGSNKLITDREPVYKQATRTINLNSEFVKEALKRGDKPHRRASQKEWDAYLRWNKMSDANKVAISLDALAHDLNCEVIDFEIL